MFARSLNCEYRQDVVDTLIDRHYEPLHRPLRRCHPRDLLMQIRNYCTYNDLPMEMTDEYFDRVVRSYFTVLTSMDDQPAAMPGRHGATEVFEVPG